MSKEYLKAGSSVNNVVLTIQNPPSEAIINNARINNIVVLNLSAATGDNLGLIQNNTDTSYIGVILVETSTSGESIKVWNSGIIDNILTKNGTKSHYKVTGNYAISNDRDWETKITPIYEVSVLF